MDYPRICPARWLSDQNFGMCMPPHDFLYPFYDIHSNYFRPWKCHNQSVSKEFSSTIENEKGNFKITLDVQHFRPDDISVKVTDKEIIVEGKHEERPDTHGFISRQFKRRYALPSHCPPENVTSTMSSDSILTIVAEKRSSNDMEKIVPIKMFGTCPKKTQIESKMTSEITQKAANENMEDMSCNKSRTKVLLKDDHSRLLKPELLKETISDTNGATVSKSTIESISNIMGMSENKEDLNMSATSNKVEESLPKSSLRLSELTEQLGQQSLASTSEMCGMKGMSNNMSKTLIEESSSSYMSSSSMSSTMKARGKIGEFSSDIISAELKEAAENI